MGNTIGHTFKISTFGESHGHSLGVIIDGCPPNLPIDLEALQRDIDRRRPGQSDIVTQRKETDVAHVLSGIFEGVTTGTPIAIQFMNQDHKSADYDSVKSLYRPGHADFTALYRTGPLPARSLRRGPAAAARVRGRAAEGAGRGPSGHARGNRDRIGQCGARSLAGNAAGARDRLVLEPWHLLLLGSEIALATQATPARHRVRPGPAFRDPLLVLHSSIPHCMRREDHGAAAEPH